MSDILDKLNILKENLKALDNQYQSTNLENQLLKNQQGQLVAEKAALIKKNEMAKMICGWCIDDKGRKILYKKKGDERYPEFKLYKMIARSVTKYVPKNIIKSKEFKKYIVNGPNEENVKNIMNIDILNI